MLTPLTEEDRDLILPWRNAPEVRRAMYSQHEITEEEHRAWFAKMRADSTREWFLYRDEGGVPQGAVYLFDWNRDHGTAFWGFYAQPEAPPGTGLFMEEDLLRYAFEDLRLHKLCCEVLASNWQVVNLHEKVGCKKEGVFRQQFWNGQEFVDIVRFGVLQDEWPSVRDYLFGRLEKLRSIRKGIDQSPPPKLS